MAWKRVEFYSLQFSIQTKQFRFSYVLQGENVSHQLATDPQQFMALADMFRNEGPISFNTDGQYFSTGGERVGEEETNP